MRRRPKLSEYQFDKWADQLKGWIRESVSPFEEDTPKKQAEREERARWDRLFFFETYLPHYFYVEFEDFHEEWSELADTADEIVPIAAPREYAKSTFFTFGVPIHDIAYEIKHFIMIVSDAGEQATGFTVPIRIELEENPRLRHDFGEFRGRKWRDGDFVTANGVRVLARGRGEKVRGLKNMQYRPDRVIVDDLENDKNVKNPRLVKEGLDWLLQAVLGSLADGFSFTMVGNKFAPRSILDQLLSEIDQETGEKLYPCGREYDAVREDGSPLWPALWTRERLEKRRRQMGTVRFNKEMRNRVGTEESPIRESWIIYVPVVELMVRKTWQVGAFLDPSGKSAEANDYKAIVVVGRDNETRLMDVLHAWIRHSTVNEMWSMVWQIDEEFGCGMGVEINMFEDFLLDSYKAHADRAGRHVRLIKERHATDKIARIVNRISPLAEFGKLRFVKGHSDQDLLVEQLIYILDANIHDDGPDALEGAVALVEGTGKAACAGMERVEQEGIQIRPGRVAAGGGLWGRYANKLKIFN
jgi:hypothetical protein